MVVIVSQRQNINEENESKMNTNVEDHFAFFKNVYYKAFDYYPVQKVQNLYNKTKNINPTVEKTLNTVEGRLDEVAQYSVPLYENYVYPTADRFIGYYSKGVESTQNTIENSKDIFVNIVVNTVRIIVGLVMAIAQTGLVLSTAAMDLVLNGLTETKNAGANVLHKTKSAEKFVEEQVYTLINHANEIAKNPVEKLYEHSHHFINVVKSVSERVLNLPEYIEDPQSTINERVANLATRILQALKDKRNSRAVNNQQNNQ